MATATSTSPLPTDRAVSDWTAADLIEHFGPIPLWRVRMVPPPGTATEQDVLDIYAREKRLCELIDGVLVEKTAGVRESYLAVIIGSSIGKFSYKHDLGFALGADGAARLKPGLIRIPDVSFVPWNRHPDRRIPDLPFVPFAPDLAVEILSPGNTDREMDRKLKDYFGAGVRLVWYVDPVKRTAEVFTAVGQSIVLKKGDTLHGGEVLPGFVLPLTTLFAGLESTQGR